jgi:hypothetical protein
VARDALLSPDRSAAPRVREDQLDHTFEVAPASSARAVDAVQALLRGVLEAPPSRKLARDYARFVVPPHGGGTTTVTGRDVQSWLDTWKAFPASLFRN